MAVRAENRLAQRRDGLNDYIAGIAAQIGPDKFSDEPELVKLARNKLAGSQRPDSSWSGPPPEPSEDVRARRDVAADAPQADDGQHEEPNAPGPSAAAPGTGGAAP